MPATAMAMAMAPIAAAPTAAATDGPEDVEAALCSTVDQQQKDPQCSHLELCKAGPCDVHRCNLHICPRAQSFLLIMALENHKYRQRSYATKTFILRLATTSPCLYGCRRD